jgi:hypothetical protein
MTGGVVGKVGLPGGAEGGMAGRVGPPTAGEAALGKGTMVGSGPQPSMPAAETTRGFAATPRPGTGVGDLGAGATALGAGGVAGALSGEDERRGRGVGRGRSASPQPGHQLPMGDLPEEEARTVRNSARLNPPAGTQQDGFLERAAARQTPGEGDAGHVRRFGVDDTDLFTDQRMVPPDVLGDDNAGRGR